MQWTDHTGYSFFLGKIPKKVVSLVPSQTELLVELGCEDQLAGITRFCIFPEGLQQRIFRIGGTKNPDIEAIRKLQPDLILANREENRKEDVEAMRTFAPVWTSDVSGLESACNMISNIGRLVGKEGNAQKICEQILSAFGDLQTDKTRKVLYLIWKKPWMGVSGNTFIGDMLRRCGWDNVLEKHPDRYPRLADDEIRALNPELILYSSEPFPFKEKHMEELKNFLTESQHWLVRGEYFSWYGSRLLHSATYFRELIHKLQTHG